MQGDGSAIIDFYRRMTGPAGPRGERVALLAPEGVSTAYGKAGRLYAVGPDRRVEVEAEDAAPLLGAGFSFPAD